MDLEQADGLNHLDGTGNRGDAGDPFPGSMNNFVWDDNSVPHAQYYDGTPSGFRMRVLGSGCGETMTATLNNQPPVAACQDVQVDADDDCLGHVTAAMVDNGSFDPDGDPITLTLFPPGPYPLGVTNVSLTVTDDKGESDTCLATITVVDTTPPEIEVTVEPQVLWPPNHKLVEVEFTVTVSDTCDDDATWVLVSVTSNEPDNGLGDGDMENDIQGADFGTADTTISLRAERSGLGAGRIYTATFEATDCAGNSAQTEARVYVPHSKNDIVALMASSSSSDGEGGTVIYQVSGASLWPKWTPAQIVDGEVHFPEAVSALITNTAGYVSPNAFYHRDLDDDGYPDVLVSFARDALLDLTQRSTEEDGEPVLVLEIGIGIFRILNLTDAEGSSLDLAGIIAGLQGGVAESGPAVGQGDPGDDLAVAVPVGLIGAVPNPFNPSITISFANPETRHVELTIYDVSGRLVDRLVSQTMSAGEHSVRWHGTDAAGERVSTGVYFYRLTAGSLVDTGRMTLVK